MQTLSKHFILCCSILFCTAFIKGQDVVLDVDLVGQKTPTSCWAACVEALLKYHGSLTTTDTQYDLISDFISLKGAAPVPNITYCDDISVSGTVGNTIPYNARDAAIKEPQFVDLIFNKLDYFSVQSPFTNLLTLSEIQNELDQCHPFLLFLNRLDPGSTFEHSIVIKGKYKNISTNEEYLLGNDPLTSNPCEGCEVAHPIRIVSDPVQMPYSATHSIRNIYPMAKGNSDHCIGQTTSASSQLLGLMTDADNLPVINSINNGIVAAIDYSDLLTDGYLETDATYITYNSNGNKITVTFKILMSNSLTYYCFPTAFGGGYHVRKITDKKCTPLQFSVLRFVPVGTNTTIDVEIGNYGLVEFLPSAQQYYSVIFENQTYLSPIRNYPELEFSKGILYPERDVLRVYERQDQLHRRAIKKLQRRELRNMRKELKN